MRVLVVAEGKHERGGALEELLKRLGGRQATFESDRVQNNCIHTHPGKGQGYFKRAVRWLLEAQKRGVDALVFLIDEDRQAERVEQINNAQMSTQSALPRALGVAIRSFDAWMLADEKALTDVLSCQIDKQPDPESIRDPKQRCAELRGRSPNDMSQSAMYAKVSGCLDLDVLRARCEKGFGPFAERVRSIFEPSG
jgi:hypothetical protein